MAAINKKSSTSKVIMQGAQNKVPFSVIEAYKNIRTNIISLLSKTDSKVLAITSPNSSEGKSTTSVNVAITLAQLEKKVLLLDTDSRRPSVHKKLKLENKIGCIDILSDNATIEESTIHFNDYLDVICSGNYNKNPSELYSSEKFDSLIDVLKESYDYIIIDTPPINPVSDTLIVAQKCDVVVMVIRSGVTLFESFEKAYDSLKVLDIELSGVIINGSDFEKKYFYKNRYKYRYKYSSDKYSRYY